MKKLAIILVLAFFSLSNFVIGQEMNAEAAKLYNEGNKNFKSGDYTGAIKQYDAALKIEQSPSILYQKSVALKKLQKYEEAEKALLKSVELDPKFKESYSGLGTTYYSMNKNDEAIKLFQKYLEI